MMKYGQVVKEITQDQVVDHEKIEAIKPNKGQAARLKKVVEEKSVEELSEPDIDSGMFDPVHTLYKFKLFEMAHRNLNSTEQFIFQRTKRIYPYVYVLKWDALCSLMSMCRNTPPMCRVDGHVNCMLHFFIAFSLSKRLQVAEEYGLFDVGDPQ